MLDNIFKRKDRNAIFDESGYYNELIYNLRMYYPGLYHDAVKYYIKSPREIIVLLGDGTYVSFYDPNKSFRVIRSPYEMNNDQFMIEFGIRLRKILNEEGITQEELSEMTGISRPTINKYIKGKSMVSSYNMTKIARALKRSITDFIFTFGEENKNVY